MYYLFVHYLFLFPFFYLALQFFLSNIFRVAEASVLESLSNCEASSSPTRSRIYGFARVYASFMSALKRVHWWSVLEFAEGGLLLKENIHSRLVIMKWLQYMSRCHWPCLFSRRQPGIISSNFNRSPRAFGRHRSYQRLCPMTRRGSRFALRFYSCTWTF